MNFFDGPTPRIFGHRGASELCPENTLISFERAIRDGAGALEIDAHLTADGVVVVTHDDTVDRTTDGHGPVRDFTFEALRALDAGARFTAADGSTPFKGLGHKIPTLSEVLGAFPDVAINLELKSAAPGIEQAVMAVLDQHQARSRTLLAAEQLSLMERIRKVAGDTITGFSLEEALEFLMRHDDASYVPRGQALQVPPEIEGEALVTRTFVAAAHARRIEVHVWVVNDPREIRSILELGVDGIMSDSPARALSVARELGLRA